MRKLEKLERLVCSLYSVVVRATSFTCDVYFFRVVFKSVSATTPTRGVAVDPVVVD